MIYISDKDNKDWLSQPWKTLTVELQKEQDKEIKYFKMHGNILRELQYIFQNEIEYAEHMLFNMGVEIKSDTDEFKIRVTSKEDYTADRIQAVLEQIALKPKSFAFKSGSIKCHPQNTPRQIAEKRAMVIYDHGTFFCVARDDDVLDRLLNEIGYNEIETIDLKKSELDLHSLGLVHADLHPNLEKVENDQSNTPYRWVFSWRGRKKADAGELIQAFKNKCNKVQIVFESSNGESSNNWANLAIELMFESKSKLKMGYLKLFNKLRYDKRVKERRYCALEHSDNKIWLYSPEDEECVKRLKSDIEASVTRHQVCKGMLSLPAIRDLMKKHPLKCLKQKDTIVCTQDLTAEIVTILSNIPHSASDEQLHVAQAKSDGNGTQNTELNCGNKQPNGKLWFKNNPCLTLEFCFETFTCISFSILPRRGILVCINVA